MLLFRCPGSNPCSSPVETQGLHWLYEIWTCSFSKVIPLDFLLCIYKATLLFYAPHCGFIFIYPLLVLFLHILGMSSTMNLSFGSLEKRGTNTSDMQLGRYMQSPRIWPLTFPSTSMYMFFHAILDWLSSDLLATYFQQGYHISNCLLSLQPKNFFECETKLFKLNMSLCRMIVLHILLEAK